MTKPVAVRKARALAQAMVLRDERAKAAAKKRRSAAARKGWETRRENAAAAAQIAEVGRRIERVEMEILAEAARNPSYGIDPAKFADEFCRIPDILRGLPPDPNPWVPIAAWVKRWWQRATQWWR